MNFNINKFNKLAGVLTLLLLLSACDNKKPDNKKEPAKQEATDEHGHSHEEEQITTLTEEQIKTVDITFGKIEQKELTATIKVNGTLRVPNNNQANVTSLFGGVIRTLRAQIGDHVRKGEAIATIENPQFVQLQEEYIGLESKITFAQQEAARQRQLTEGGAGALKNLQSADSDIKLLKARKASLEKQIRLMGINPANIHNSNLRSSLVVTSPISGTVSNVFAKIGSYVDVSSPVIEVIDNSQLHLDLQVFEKDLPKLKTGQQIYFTLTNNPATQYSAKVYSIGSSFENNSKSIAVHSTVQGNKIGLINGMNVTAMVSLSNVSTPAVPDDAIVNADGKYYIFIVTDKEPEPHDSREEAGHNHKDGEANNHEHKESETHEHKEGETHSHKEGETHEHGKKTARKINFEKIEVLKGTSDMGYTAITPVTDIPADAKIATKNAFFINAKMSNTGGHAH